MDRRCALTLILVCALVPGASNAQKQQKRRRIGYFSAASAVANAPRLAAFRDGMKQLGWTEGEDFIIDARYGDAAAANISQLAAEVVAAKPDIILTPSDDAIVELAKATKTIPIVFATALDPIGIGAVKTLQRPGGNVTGVATLAGPLGAKRVQLLKETFPQITHIAVVFDGKDGGSVSQLPDLMAAATHLRIQVTRVEVNQAGEIEAAIRRARSLGCQAFITADSYLFNSQRKGLTEAIQRTGLPAIYPRAEHVDAGGLMAYAASTTDNFRRSAGYVDKILKGANPAELPVEQPSKIDLTINLRTAKAMGINMPPSTLVRADRVVQ